MRLECLTPRPGRWQTLLVFWGLAFAVCVLWLAPPAAEIPALLGWTLAVLVLGGWWLAFAGPAARSGGGFPAPAALTLACAWLISALASSDPASAWNALARDLSCLLVFTLAWFSARNFRGVLQGFSWLATLAFLLAVYGVYQHVIGLQDTAARFFGAEPASAPWELAAAARLASGRAFSLFVYPNTYAGWLAGVLPVTLALAFLGKTRLGRVWFWLCAAGLLVGLQAAGSLGGWAAAAAGLGVFGWLRPVPPGSRRRVWPAAVLAVVVLGAGWLLASRSAESAAAAVNGRWQYWLGAWRMACDHPGLGVGPGLFGVYYPAYRSGTEFARFAHSAPLQALAEGGFLAAGAWIWLLAGLARALKPAFHRQGSSRRAWLTAGLAAGLAAFVLHAAVDVDGHFLKNAVTVWFWLGVLGGLTAAAAGSAPAPVKTGSRFRAEPWQLAALLALLAGATWHGGRAPSVEAVLPAAVCLLAAWRWSTRPRPGPAAGSAERTVLAWPLGAFLLWGVVSAWNSSYPGGAWEALVPGAVGLLVCWLAASLTGNHQNDDSGGKPPTGIGKAAGVVSTCVAFGSYTAPGALLAALTACAGVWGAIALGQAWREPGVRAAAYWPNANLLAALLAAGLIAWTARLLGSDWTGRRRWVAGLGALGLFAALLAAGSFGGALNLGIGLLLLAAWSWKDRRPRALLVLAGLAAAAALAWGAPFAFGHRLSRLPDYRRSAWERIEMARAAVKAAAARPLTGWGPGQFGAAFERVSFPNPGGVARYGRTTEFAHSEWLQAAAVLGWPGLAILVWLAGAAVWTGRRQWRRVQNATGPPAWQPAAIWAVLAGSAAQASVDFNWHAPALLTWGLALLGAALARPAEPSRGSAARPGGEVAVAWGLALVLATLAVRPAFARAWLASGEQQLRRGGWDAAVSDFQRVQRLAPWSAEAYLGAGRARLAAARAGDPGQAPAAEAELLQAWRRDRGDYAVARALAQTYRLQAEFAAGPARAAKLSEAAVYGRRARALAPRQARLAFDLGNLYRDQGDLPRAETEWAEAAALEPAYAAAWSNLAAALDLRGDPGAEAAYRRALAAVRLAASAESEFERELTGLDERVVHHNLARWLEKQGRRQEAAEEFEQASIGDSPGGEAGRGQR